MTLPNGRELDDRRVTQFAAVVASGSVRGGAEALDVDPSVISRSIARLEEEWGMMLLERKGRGIAVTEAGKLVYDYFLRHQSLRRDLIAQVEAMATLDGGHVDVICGNGYSKIISLAVRSFLEKHPNIRFHVETDSSPDAQKRILDDEFMIGLLFTKVRSPNLYRHHSLSEPICAIVRNGHPLTQTERKLRLADLLPYNGCLVSKGYSIRQIISSAEVYERLMLNVTISSACFDLVRAAILKSDVYALLPPRAAKTEIDNGQLVPLPINNPVLLESENCIVSRRGRMLPPAARAFAAHLVSVYSKVDGNLTPGSDELVNSP